MTPDPKLVEAVAQAICAAAHCDWDDPLAGADFDASRRHFRGLAEAALTAIDASGDWWIAPRDADQYMTMAAYEFWTGSEPTPKRIECIYAGMRDAYLAICPPYGVSKGEALAYRSMPEFPGKKGG